MFVSRPCASMAACFSLVLLLLGHFSGAQAHDNSTTPHSETAHPSNHTFKHSTPKEGFGTTSPPATSARASSSKATSPSNVVSTSTPRSRFGAKVKVTRASVLAVVIFLCFFGPIFITQLMSSRAKQLHAKSVELQKKQALEAPTEPILKDPTSSVLVIPSSNANPIPPIEAKKNEPKNSADVVSLCSSDDVDGGMPTGLKLRTGKTIKSKESSASKETVEFNKLPPKEALTGNKASSMDQVKVNMDRAVAPSISPVVGSGKSNTAVASAASEAPSVLSATGTASSLAKTKSR